jgi:opacity protein-like surface antigen
MTGNFIPTVSGGVPFPGSTGSETKTLFGFTVGAGAAYALAPNWDIGAEYRYCNIVATISASARLPLSADSSPASR